MIQTAEVPALEPVSDLLCEAIGVGLERQPVTLPSSTAFRYAPITQCYSPRILVKEHTCDDGRDGHSRAHCHQRTPGAAATSSTPANATPVFPVYPVRLARAMGLCGSVRIW